MSRPYANEQSFPTAELEADAARNLGAVHSFAGTAYSFRDSPAVALKQLRSAMRIADRALAKLEELEARRKEQAEVRGEAVAS